MHFRVWHFSEVVVPMRDVRSWGKTGSGQRWGEPTRMTRMYGPAAFRNRDRAWVTEVADMYPACLIGSRAVALMGIRTHLWFSGQVGKQPLGSPDS